MGCGTSKDMSMAARIHAPQSRHEIHQPLMKESHAMIAVESEIMSSSNIDNVDNVDNVDDRQTLVKEEEALTTALLSVPSSSKEEIIDVEKEEEGKGKEEYLAIVPNGLNTTEITSAAINAPIIPTTSVSDSDNNNNDSNSKTTTSEALNEAASTSNSVPVAVNHDGSESDGNTVMESTAKTPPTAVGARKKRKKAHVSNHEYTHQQQQQQQENEVTDEITRVSPKILLDNHHHHHHHDDSNDSIIIANSKVPLLPPVSSTASLALRPVSSLPALAMTPNEREKHKKRQTANNNSGNNNHFSATTATSAMNPSVRHNCAILRGRQFQMMLQQEPENEENVASNSGNLPTAANNDKIVSEIIFGSQIYNEVAPFATKRGVFVLLGVDGKIKEYYSPVSSITVGISLVSLNMTQMFDKFERAFQSKTLTPIEIIANSDDGVMGMFSIALYEDVGFILSEIQRTVLLSTLNEINGKKFHNINTYITQRNCFSNAWIFERLKQRYAGKEISGKYYDYRKRIYLKAAQVYLDTVASPDQYDAPDIIKIRQLIVPTDT